MQIASLDLGTLCGWCCGDVDATADMPDWGVWELAGASKLDESFLGLYNELTVLIETRQPAYLVYENPLTRSNRDSSRNIIDLLVGLAAVTRLVGKLWATPVFGENFATARKAVLGRGTFARPFRGQGKISERTGQRVGDAKEEVRLWLAAYGWSAIDQPDAADAALLFRYAQILSRPKRRLGQ